MSAPETEHDQLARIRKLLDKAEHASTPAKEAEALRERAFALAAKFEIDHALIRARGNAPTDAVINRIFDVGRPYAYQVRLAYNVYKSSGCEVIQLTGYKGRLHVFGFKSDIDRADMLWTSLVVQATRETVRGYREYQLSFTPTTCANCGGSNFARYDRDRDWCRCRSCGFEIEYRDVHLKLDRRSTWYRSFWLGWITVLEPRIAALRSSAKQEAEKSTGTGVEIALRNRDIAVTDAVDRVYPHRKIGRSTLRSSGSGYAQGQEAGRRADIGSEKIGATRRELR